MLPIIIKLQLTLALRRLATLQFAQELNLQLEAVYTSYCILPKPDVLQMCLPFCLQIREGTSGGFQVGEGYL